MVEEEPSVETIGEEFIQIMEKNRIKLPEFLNTHGSFSTLWKMWRHLENKEVVKDPEGGSYPIQLLLGQRGFPAYQQQALYELPTHELLLIIEGLVKKFAIPGLVEIAAGRGLLAALLRKRLDIVYRVTEGRLWLETSSEGKSYVDSESKTMVDLIGEVDTPIDHMIISWPPINSLTGVRISQGIKVFELYELIRHKAPRICIIICEPLEYSVYTHGLACRLQSIGYRIIPLPGKQISYRDYQLWTEDHVADTSRSVVNLCLRTSEFPEIAEITQESLIAELGGDLFHGMPEPPDRYRLIQDLTVDRVLPVKLQQLIPTHPEIVPLVAETLKKSAMIPSYIHTLGELKFWWNLQEHNKIPDFPDEAPTIMRNDFLMFRHLFQQIQDGEFEQLVNGGMIPPWANTPIMAERFLWLEFSTNPHDKKWKESEGTFRQRLSQMFP